jgi:hypothetical protein
VLLGQIVRHLRGCLSLCGVGDGGGHYLYRRKDI